MSGLMIGLGGLFLLLAVALCLACLEVPVIAKPIGGFWTQVAEIVFLVIIGSAFGIPGAVMMSRLADLTFYFQGTTGQLFVRSKRGDEPMIACIGSCRSGKVTEMFLLLVFKGLEYVEAMRTEQNSLGFLKALSDKLWGDANSRQPTPSSEIPSVRQATLNLWTQFLRRNKERRAPSISIFL